MGGSETSRNAYKQAAYGFHNRSPVTRVLFNISKPLRTVNVPFECIMKPQLIGTKKRPSVTSVTASEVALSLQEELVAAIHGAFEVAVEIAVREVTELVGQATGDIYEEMRRENETLKQRLRRAEAMLEEGGGSTPAAQQTDQHHLNYSQIAQKPKADTAHSRTGGRGETPPAGHSCAHQSPPDHKGDCVSRSEEQRSDDVRTQLVSDAASDLEKERNNGCAALIKGLQQCFLSLSYHHTMSIQCRI